MARPMPPAAPVTIADRSGTAGVVLRPWSTPPKAVTERGRLAAESSGGPREDPRGLPLRRLLQLREGAAELEGRNRACRCRSSSARSRSSAASTRPWRCCACAGRGRPAARGRTAGSRSTSCAARGRRDLAGGDGDYDRGRLIAVGPPRDGLPRLHGARTLVMRNVREVVDAAFGKPILYFPPATTTGWSRPATAGRLTWRARSASPPTRRRPGGAGAASARAARADRRLRRGHGARPRARSPTASATR